MKKLLLTLTLVAGGYCVSNGQTATDIYNTFASEAKATTVSLGDFVLKLAGEHDSMAKDIESIRVLSLSECSQSVKDKFAKEASSLPTGGYETLVRVNKDDNMVKVLVKAAGDKINEMLVIVTGKDPVLVTLKGSMSKSELLSKADTWSGWGKVSL